MVKKIGGWSRLRKQCVQRAGGRRLLCVCAKFVGYWHPVPSQLMRQTNQSELQGPGQSLAFASSVG